MIQFRDLTPYDRAVIRAWPPYPRVFEELDYALRGEGWLSEFLGMPDTWCFGVEQRGELVAFTILARTGEGEAEFRIAVRADKTGQGLGGAITTMTLAKGFDEIGLTRIHLIVRKNHPKAIRLYTSLGFKEAGECLKEVDGKQVHFLIMDVLKTPCSV